MVTVSPAVRDRLLYLCPVVVTTVLGATWIAVHAGGGRGHAHTWWQVLVLAESSAALLLRRRKPTGSLAGVVLAYGLFKLYAITLLPVLIAMYTVARLRGRRMTVAVAVATALVVAAVPRLDRGTLSPATCLGLAVAVGCSAAAGGWLRARRPVQAGATSRVS